MNCIPRNLIKKNRPIKNLIQKIIMIKLETNAITAPVEDISSKTVLPLKLESFAMNVANKNVNKSSSPFSKQI